MIAACLLESAMRNSPYNAYLKICAMNVYGGLNAASRSWELYTELNVKHIQNESCTFLILPLLRSGGMYPETISVCKEILFLQRTSGRDIAEYTARAMEHGTVSKAQEFMDFYREKMVKSLTTLEAKGLILDAAPLLVDESEVVLGSAHGIVGSETDLERVKQMVAEAHNPSGAFSLLQLDGPVAELCKQATVNADRSILSYEILAGSSFDTPEVVLSESIRRAHQHNILIRTALLMDAAKGPKKGKATKSSLESAKRTKSLLKSLSKATTAAKSLWQAPGYARLLESMIDLCIAIVALSAGMNVTGDVVYETMESREEAVFSAIQRACASMQAACKETMETNDVTVPRASRLLPECVAPVFAVFQMLAKLVDLFGWGRRKRKTKKCAEAVASFASSFAQLILGIKASIEWCVTYFDCIGWLLAENSTL
jgi:N-acetyltransferase B complex (NatB) non catalytic subunit